MWADDKSGKSKIYFIKGKVQLTNVNVKGALPDQFYIEQNYPNPFNPTTIINYSIPKQSYVTIKIIDALGREISTLVNEEKPAGNHKIIFNAVDLTSGVYFYQIKADKFMQTNKMILLR
ncbi:MAG: T9SS type A sorting domain-containing protein [Bacteroidetes bacterium]|nr:T9SS type A sorting domain-containing protein [Bacteroidota bacterium]